MRRVPPLLRQKTYELLVNTGYKAELNSGSQQIGFLLGPPLFETIKFTYTWLSWSISLPSCIFWSLYLLKKISPVTEDHLVWIGGGLGSPCLEGIAPSADESPTTALFKNRISWRWMWTHAKQSSFFLTSYPLFFFSLSLFVFFCLFVFLYPLLAFPVISLSVVIRLFLNHSFFLYCFFSF